MPAARDAGYLPAQLQDLNVRASCVLTEDFPCGALTSGLTPIDCSTTSASTNAGVTGRGGKYSCLPTTTNEVGKAAGLYQNDVLSWSIGWGFVLAMRFQVVTLPAAATSIMVFGVTGARGAANGTAVVFNDIAESIWFRLSGDGNLLFGQDDGTTDSGELDTTLDVVADQYVTLVIDTRQRSRVAAYAAIDINDELIRVLPNTQFNYAAASTGMFQIFCEIQSATAAAPRVDFDWIRAWQSRSTDTASSLFPAVTF